MTFFTLVLIMEEGGGESRMGGVEVEPSRASAAAEGGDMAARAALDFKEVDLVDLEVEVEDLDLVEMAVDGLVGEESQRREDEGVWGYRRGIKDAWRKVLILINHRTRVSSLQQPPTTRPYPSEREYSPFFFSFFSTGAVGGGTTTLAFFFLGLTTSISLSSLSSPSLCSSSSSSSELMTTTFSFFFPLLVLLVEVDLDFEEDATGLALDEEVEAVVRVVRFGEEEEVVVVVVALRLGGCACCTEWS